MPRVAHSTVILAAGDFPRRGGAAYQALSEAKKVVCCDSAADAYKRAFRKEPTLVVGDCDSVRGRFAAVKVHIGEQETNDLEKAIRVCRAKGWKNLLIVGATGKREDHTLGNIFRALDAGIPILTDFGAFHILEPNKKNKFKLPLATALSIFISNPKTRLKSTGLEWSLDRVRFKNLYCATLNRSNRPVVTLTTTHRAYLYEAFEHRGKIV